MPHEKGHHPGAVWRKADLQCHSPRDQGWTQPPSLPGGTLSTRRSATTGRRCLSLSVAAVTFSWFQLRTITT
jgi:hypothetical protein